MCEDLEPLVELTKDELTIRCLKKEISNLQDDNENKTKEIFKMNTECYENNKKVEDWENKFKLASDFFIALLRNDKLETQNQQLRKMLKDFSIMKQNEVSSEHLSE